MKKKILFVITKSNWGGAQRYVFDLASALPSDEFDVSVACGGTGEKNAEPGRLEQKLKDKNIRTIFIDSFMRDISVRKEIAAFWELCAIYKNERPDIVHLNSSKAGGLGALAGRITGVKSIVFTSHGLAYDEDRNVAARALIWLSTWLTFLLCHRVIVISTDNLRRAKRLPFCAKKLTLIHNGISPISYLANDEARATLSQKMTPVPQSPMWIGTISNLEWNKGLHYLVRAAGDLKRKGLDFALCVIGEGAERIFLETLITDEDVKDRVFLVGFIEQAAQYVRAFDVFVMPSSKEGLPYGLLEAGLAGEPCVASDIPAHKDIVTDGVSGLLCKSKNHADLAIKLEAMLRDDTRSRYGTALKERVEKTFSVTHMTEETKKLYA